MHSVRISIASSVVALFGFACLGSMPAGASEVIVEDVLNLRELPYGLKDWPANRLLTIKSPLIDTPVGFAYISKAGYREQGLGSLVGELLLSPFTIIGSIVGGSSQKHESDERGRVIANLWVSKQGTCSFHTILQKRFYGDGDDNAASEYLNIRRLDIGAGQEIVSLEASGSPQLFQRATFTYSRCGRDQYRDCPEYNGQQYVLRRDWILTPASVRALSAMPSKPFKVRYVFSTHTQVAEVPDGGAVAKVFSSCS